MGSSNDDSQKLTLTAQEAAEFFRRLAESFERDSVTIGEIGLTPRGLLKIRMKGKRKIDRSELSVKVCWKEEESEELPPDSEAAPVGEADQPSDDVPERPKYKKLKKRIEGLWKRIRKDLAADVIPAESLARAFDRDAELMVLYPKKGDLPSLDEFRRLSADFLDAVRAADLERIRTAAAALRKSEKACHDRFA